MKELAASDRKKQTPDFVARAPVETDEKTIWKEVGIAFYNEKSKSITIYLDEPVQDKKIVLFKKNKDAGYVI